MQFKFFVGIDVSKNTLDFAIVTAGNHMDSFTVGNSQKEIKSAVKKLRSIYECDNTLFCMEQTGIYNNHLTTVLTSLGCSIWVERPIQIKRSSGLQRGKSDRVDAQRIASYAFRNQDKARIWKAPRIVMQQLKRLTALRDRLLLMVSQIRIPLEESKKFDPKEVFNVVKSAGSASLKAIKADLKNIDKKIVEVLKSDPSLKHLFELVTSVNGIGTVIACEMILTTNEFKSIADPKKYACYSGVVPFEHSSGISIRGKHRVSHFANKNVKRLLHLAAMSVIRYPGELKTYWERKIREGKHKMVVLNAIRNKLIQRVFAVVRRGEKFEKIYSNLLERS